MSADDPLKRPRAAPEALSLDDLEEEGPAEGAFFRAPTKAFQTLPTEVLDVGSGPGAKESATVSATASGTSSAPSDGHAGRLPSSLFEERSDGALGGFPTPPPTEALSADEVRRLTRRHAPIAASPSQDALEVTNPEPFRVELDSEERALLEVAREPTQHDLYLDDLVGPPSETSTDVEAPKPVSGLLDLGSLPTNDGFEDRTVALEALEALEAPAAAHAPSPLSEPTDEDAVLPSDEYELELEPSPAAPSEGTQDEYYRELRDVIGAARVFDPRRHPQMLTDPGFREDSDDEWPEITLPPAPAPKPPPAKERRFPLGLVAFLASALVVSAGGVGIGISLSKRGVQLDDVLATVGLGDSESDGSKSEKAKGAIDPTGAWKGRTVQVHLAKLDDASRSGDEKLAETLGKAFASALGSDEHASWQVVSSPPSEEHGFEVSLSVLSVEEGDEGSLHLRCALEASRRHAPGGEVKVAVGASRRAEGSFAGAERQKVAQEAARACGFALALAFFGPALSEPPFP